MNKRIWLPVILLLALAMPCIAQSVPVDSAWVIDPGTTQQASPNVIPGGISFQFYRSPLPDPNATPPWTGYFLRPWTSALTGPNLVITFRVKTKKGQPEFNYKSESFNTGISPAKVRLYFQTSALYNSDETTRWWADQTAIVLNDAVAQGQITISVPLNPAYWSDTFGHQGNLNPTTQAGFYNALFNPTYVGVTFGGGDFFGHGTNTSFGKAAFQLFSFASR